MPISFIALLILPVLLVSSQLNWPPTRFALKKPRYSSSPLRAVQDLEHKRAMGLKPDLLENSDVTLSFASVTSPCSIPSSSTVVDVQSPTVTYDETPPSSFSRPFRAPLMVESAARKRELELELDLLEMPDFTSSCVTSPSPIPFAVKGKSPTSTYRGALFAPATPRPSSRPPRVISRIERISRRFEQQRERQRLEVALLLTDSGNKPLNATSCITERVLERVISATVEPDPPPGAYTDSSSTHMLVWIFPVAVTMLFLLLYHLRRKQSLHRFEPSSNSQGPFQICQSLPVEPALPLDTDEGHHLQQMFEDIPQETPRAHFAEDVTNMQTQESGVEVVPIGKDEEEEEDGHSTIDEKSSDSDEDDESDVEVDEDEIAERVRIRVVRLIIFGLVEDIFENANRRGPLNEEIVWLEPEPIEPPFLVQHQEGNVCISLWVLLMENPTVTFPIDYVDGDGRSSGYRRP
ncbi:hypothetical protein C0991_006246 [Blastosporella zonata]|nr:hypothetical protein C0991_006246 [Blastosporella zonata]